MRSLLLLSAAALALGACQSAEEKHAAETGEVNVTNATTAEVAKLMKAASEKTAVQPGLWKAQLRIESVETANGTTPRMVEAAKRMERDATECRTAEQLKPFDIAKLEKAAGTCTFARFNSGGGRIDAQISCAKPNAPTTAMSITGSTSKTAFDVVTDSVTGTPGKPDYSRIRLRTSGSRIGDCQS